MYFISIGFNQLWIYILGETVCICSKWIGRSQQRKLIKVNSKDQNVTHDRHFLRNAPNYVAESTTTRNPQSSTSCLKYSFYCHIITKVQGQALSRVVLLPATIGMYFVRISRVRDGDHLRIVPCARTDLDYVEKLRFCSHVRYWYNNYDNDGRWNLTPKFILPSIEPWAIVPKSCFEFRVV